MWSRYNEARDLGSRYWGTGPVVQVLRYGTCGPGTEVRGTCGPGTEVRDLWPRYWGTGPVVQVLRCGGPVVQVQRHEPVRNVRTSMAAGQPSFRLQVERARVRPRNSAFSLAMAATSATSMLIKCIFAKKHGAISPQISYRSSLWRRLQQVRHL